MTTNTFSNAQGQVFVDGAAAPFKVAAWLHRSWCPKVQTLGTPAWQETKFLVEPHAVNCGSCDGEPLMVWLERQPWGSETGT